MLTIEKQGVRRAPDAPGRPVTYPDVLRVLQGDETRFYALSRFRDAGFSGDSWSRRATRVAMVEALVATEDWLEYRGVDRPRRAHLYDCERLAIRGVRRRLEAEVA